MDAINVASTFKDNELEALVATGVVDEVIIPFHPVGTVLVYKLQEGPECIEFETLSGAQAEFRRIVLARHAFRRCAKRITRGKAANAPIQLFGGDRAPNRYTGPACLGGGNYPLELRLAPDHGGGLVAFWESPGYVPHAFPPYLWVEQTWQCEPVPWIGADRRDIFRFVSTALGFKEVDDFSRSPKPQLVPETLQLLKAKLGSLYAHDHILALLGQWPSTPSIDQALDDPRLFEHGAHIIRTAAALLTDPGNEDRRKRLYPHLSTHVSSLLRICARRGNRFDTEEACARLASAAKATATRPPR
jgi:hypothetical protein